ncbi:MAG: DUF3365 domain-containing protein [Gammaproteobacteria bacterium]|nr:MAG: DUF3365 domain-containing protein [Gammaproteobacteria bacterium]
MKLTLKFNLVLILVFTLGLAVTGVLSYRILQENAFNEVVQRAGLMMDAALAMRRYTVKEIKPLLALQMKKVFLPQSVPAYAATTTFNQVREKHAEFAYKEATLNPSNPQNRAVAWEADIVQEFRNNPERKEVIGVRDTPTGQSLYLARPMQVKNPGCLTCHSTVERAPQTLKAKYGTANGFGWKMNEIVGARIVSVPLSVPLRQAEDAFRTFMTLLVAIFVAIVVILNIMLRSIVIKPVTKMARIADEVSKGNMETPEFSERGTDEISVLAASFNRMRRSLEKAMKMLEE